MLILPLQSMKESERPFHETLVHPAMFAHAKPKHVAVIGGGEGATIRELLKHKTVESVTMIEIDELMVEIAKEHLPYMSDCSDIDGVSKSCFDDERTTIIHENAILWFKDHYGPKGNKQNDRPVPSFDVIILDGFDPKDGSEMYTDTAFLDALYASLSKDGVFALHVGNPFSIHDPKPDIGLYAPREKFFNILENHPSTAAMMVYEEAHAGFEEPHAFLTVCKSAECRSRWYSESVVIDDEIYERIKSSNSGDPTLIHYDGASHRTFQITPRAWETVYCRREPEPFECAYRGLDVNKELFEMGDDEEDGSFMVKTDTVDGKEAKSVFANEDIPKGSYIMPSDVAASVALSDDVINGLKDNIAVKETGEVTVIENFLDFVDKNGHASMVTGTKLNYVEVGGSTFIRKSKNGKEVNVGRWLPDHPSGKLPVWSPVYERRMMAFDVFIVATKDIKAGEEIVRPVQF
jgi:spermidine synthase